jgi:hypothetical protein
MIPLLVNSVVAIAGAFIVATAAPMAQLDRVVAWLLLLQAWVTAVLLTAGLVLGRLDAVTITAVNVGLAVLAAALTRPWRKVDRASVGRAATSVRGVAAAVPGVIRRHPAVALLGAGVCVAIAWKTVQALRLPVLDFDGFSYHLVTVDVWLQSGSIGRVPQRIWSDGYPANGELITLWLMAFTRNDTLANLTALHGVPLAMTATAGLARVLGARRDLAILAGLVAGATPAVIALAASTYVDIWAMADIAAAAFFGARAFRARDDATVPLLLTGVAMGLAVGTKASMAIPAAAIWLAIVIGRLVVRRRPAAEGPAGRPPISLRVRSAARAAVVAGVPTAVFGGTWYLKDLVVFGNPIWPFRVGPFPGLGDFSMITQTPRGLAGLPGIVAILRSWTADPGVTTYPYDTRIGGFGVAWVVLIVLAGIGLVLADRAVRPYVAVVLGAMVLTLVTMPMGWWPRLTLDLVVVVVALAAVALSRLPRPAATAAVGLVVVLSLWSAGIAAFRSNLGVAGGGAPPGPLRLAGIMAAGNPLRTDLGLWATCATVDRLPDGSRVVADGFGLIHAIVGHELERVALPPIETTADPVALHERLQAAGATQYVVTPDSPGYGAAASRPDLFVRIGPTCRSAMVYAVAPQTARA